MHRSTTVRSNADYANVMVMGSHGKLELIPKGFPPPDEVANVLEDFNSQFGTITSDGERLLKLVDDAGTDLTACDPSCASKCALKT